VVASVGVSGCWYYVAAYRFDALVQMTPVLVKPRISSVIRGEISSLWCSDIAKIAHARPDRNSVSTIGPDVII